MSGALIFTVIIGLLSVVAIIAYVLKREDDLNTFERLGLCALAASILLSGLEGFAPQHYPYVPVADIHRAIWEANLGRLGILTWIWGVYRRHRAQRKTPGVSTGGPAFIA